MDKLRGFRLRQEATPDAAGKPWLPFHYDPARAAKMARLHRLHRKGLTPPTDKASLRQAAEQAVAERGKMDQKRG